MAANNKTEKTVPATAETPVAPQVQIWEFRHKGVPQYYRAATYAEARKQYKDWNNLD